MGIEAEQTQKESIDLQAIADSELVEQVDEEQKEPIQLSDTEQKAHDQGWRPIEEFKGPEDNWKTAKEYVRDGEWIEKLNSLKGQIDSQKKSFDDRLDNSNKLHEARRKSEIKTLKSEQRDAVLDSNTTKFDSAQEQIDELETQTVDDKTVVQVVDPTMAAWEEKNPWINDKSDFKKRPIAQDVWGEFRRLNPKATTQQCLDHVDAKLNEVFPTNNENPRRNQPNTMENNRKPSKQKSKGLTMADLTPQEKQDWNQFGSIMFTEEKFLKTVADTRTK